MKLWQLQPFYTIFDLYAPSNICEIGTHNARTACQFVKYLAPRVNRLHYTGYDLFEDADPVITQQEHNGKGPGAEINAMQSLAKMQSRHANFTFEVTQGNTKSTLTQPKTFDFVYIDGGHSYDTVMHDFTMVCRSTALVFDDYQIKEVRQAVDEIIVAYPDYLAILLPTNNIRLKRQQMAMFWEPDSKLRSRLNRLLV
jgi:hypothetical protein